MSRFEQRKKQHLQNAEVRAGYEEAEEEFALLHVLDRARHELGVTQTELADILGTTQPAVSQVFSGTYAVSVEKIVGLLHALHLQAKVQIGPAPEDEPALVVSQVHLPESLSG
jgi:transcriptional regulator with XRE-family HTH domain